MNKRERLSVVLKLLGLHGLERRLYRAEVRLVERRERTRIRVLAAVVPAAAWTAIVVYSAAVLARALRTQTANQAHKSTPSPSTSLAANTRASGAIP